MLLNGKAPLPGQIKTFPTLAQTFRTLAEKGSDGFYKGRIAEEIVKLIQSKGGVMELEDLAAHKTDFVEPIKYTYGGEVTIYEVPLSTQHETSNKLLTGYKVSSEWSGSDCSTRTRHFGQHSRTGLDQALVRDGAQFARILTHPNRGFTV
jgi:gamma-glutamyltranspeptidase